MSDYAKFKVGEQWVARIYKGSTLIYELKQGGGETEEEFDARVRETIQGVIDGTISVNDCQTTGQEAAGKYPEKYRYAGSRNYSDIAAVSAEGDIVDWSAVSGPLAEETVTANLMSLEEAAWAEGEGSPTGWHKFFVSCRNFTSPMPCLYNGRSMFWRGPLYTFTSAVPNLKDGTAMFRGCQQLNTFTASLPKLEVGHGMFEECPQLTQFSSELPSLQDGRAMFKKSGLTSWEIDIPALEYGHCMFYEGPLQSFSASMGNLKQGDFMFMNCINLETFDSEMRCLSTANQMFDVCTSLQTANISGKGIVDANHMFRECRQLSSLSGEFETLHNGQGMFTGCEKLNYVKFNPSIIPNGQSMFEGCCALNTLYGTGPYESGAALNFSNLTNGISMFRNCVSLTYLDVEFPSLTNGKNMFANTSIKKDSVVKILNSLPSKWQSWSGSSTFTVTSPSSGAIQFTDDLEDAVAHARYGGWNVEHNFSGDIVQRAESVIERNVAISCASVGKEIQPYYETSSVDAKYKYAGADSLDDITYKYPDYVIEGKSPQEHKLLSDTKGESWGTCDKEFMSLQVADFNVNCAEFTGHLPNLIDGSSMFANGPLTRFERPLSTMEEQWGMFMNCNSLTTFTSDLTSLDNGIYMFMNCPNLSSFSAVLPSITSGESMFYECSNLSSFVGDTPQLKYAYGMFNQCTKLTSFSGDLSSLVSADNMFYQCKLDQDSVDNIYRSIRNLQTNPGTSTEQWWSGYGKLTLGVADEVNDRAAEFYEKGWTVNGYSPEDEDIIRNEQVQPERPGPVG